MEIRRFFHFKAEGTARVSAPTGIDDSGLPAVQWLFGGSMIRLMDRSSHASEAVE